MKVELLKDWGNHKKASILDIKDQTVIDKGLKIGLFKKESKKKTK